MWENYAVNMKLCKNCSCVVFCNIVSQSGVRRKLCMIMSCSWTNHITESSKVCYVRSNSSHFQLNASCVCIRIIYWTSPHRERKETQHLTQGRSHNRSEVFPNHNQALTLETNSAASWNWYAPPVSNFDKHYFVQQISWILRREHMIITANNCRWLLWNKIGLSLEFYIIKNIVRKILSSQSTYCKEGRSGFLFFIKCFTFVFFLLLICNVCANMLIFF